MDWWTAHRNWVSDLDSCAPTEEAICALLFNAMGYLHERLKGRDIGYSFYPPDSSAVATHNMSGSPVEHKAGLGIPVKDINNLTEEEKRKVRAMNKQRDTGGRH